MKRKFFSFVAAACPVLAVGVALALARRPSDPDLLQRAHVVARMDLVGLFACSHGLLGDGYEWVDDHRVLGFFRGGPSQGSPSLQDLRTGTTAPFTVPSAIDGGVLSGVSPDGQWLLWSNHDSWHGDPVATSLDGRRTIAWHRPSNTFGLTWTPDSARWIVTTSPGGTTGYSALAVGGLHDAKPHEIPLRPISAYSSVAGFLGTHTVLIRDRFMPTFAPDFPGDPPTQFHVVDLNAPARALPAIPVQVPIVPGTQQACALVSPRGDRILWWFRHGRSTSDIPMMPSPSLSLTVYVTDLQGQHLQHIGCLQLRQNGLLSAPRWCPDGKHISFIWVDKLYCLSV